MGGLTTGEKVAIAVLLLIPVVFYMAYNYASPELLGVPFFYWFQTLWLAISAVLFTVAAVIWERGLSREEKR